MYLDVVLDTITHGKVKVDISFGGAFFAFVPAQRFNLDVRTSKLRDIVEVATEVSNAVKEQVIVSYLRLFYACSLTNFLVFFSHWVFAFFSFSLCIFPHSVCAFFPLSFVQWKFCHPDLSLQCVFYYAYFIMLLQVTLYLILIKKVRLFVCLFVFKYFILV